MIEAARLLGLDPRLKLAWALGAGLLVWASGPTGLTAWVLVLSWLLRVLRPHWGSGVRFTRGILVFVLFWAAAKAVLDLWSGAEIGAALGAAGLLGLRLFCLVLLGLCLSLAVPPRQMGLSLAWAGRPLLGRRAWELALALSLMVHFLPLAWRVMAQVRQTLALRGRGLGLVRRMSLFAGAVLRNLGSRAFEQALALASRRLDSPEAWERSLGWEKRDWVRALGLLAGLAALSLA